MSQFQVSSIVMVCSATATAGQLVSHYTLPTVKAKTGPD